MMWTGCGFFKKEDKKETQHGVVGVGHHRKRLFRAFFLRDLHPSTTQKGPESGRVHRR